MAGPGRMDLDRRSFLKNAAVAGASGMVLDTEGKKPMDAHTQQPWSMKMVVPIEPGIVCSDLDRMLEFYTGVLGLKKVSDAEATPEMSRNFRAAPDGFRIVRLQTPYGERIKLVQTKMRPLKKPPLTEWTFERHGISYITFVIADMNEMVARLHECKVKFVLDEPLEVRKGFVALFVLDPEENYIEFVQYQDPASYRPDLFKWRQFF